MLTGAEIAAMVAAVVGVLGLVGTGAGWLARRDNRLGEQVGENADAVDELDTSFARVTTRLFGLPDDGTDHGVIGTRAERMDRAEREIDSLFDGVQFVVAQAEENGDHLEDLDERVTEHAEETRSALRRIEQSLNEEVIPEDDFPGGEGN